MLPISDGSDDDHNRNIVAEPVSFRPVSKFHRTVQATAGTPAGTVTFKDGATVLDAVALSVGLAKVTTASLSVGSPLDHSGLWRQREFLSQHMGGLEADRE